MAENLTAPGNRIVVVGVTGAGKTTTAQQIAKICGVPHVELDSLHWAPGWQMVERDLFRGKVAEVLSAPGWVTDGNYSKARDIIWGRADTIIWLDYSLQVVLWQLFRRTVQRVISREELWNGNRETLRGAFFSRDSLFLWALQSYSRHRMEYPQLLASPEYTHLQLIHLRSRRETARWLAWLAQHSAQEILRSESN